MLKQLRYAVPLLVFVLVLGLLWRGLGLHPRDIPSPLIDEPAPAFALPDLFDPKKLLTNKDFPGQVILFNIWASWCSACAQEHEFLLHLVKTEHITLYGLDYKDDSNDAKAYLKQLGNPYKRVASDASGATAIDWGVYGTPETYVIDKKGVIRYKQLGYMTPEIWENDIKPVVKKLESESP